MSSLTRKFVNNEIVRKGKACFSVFAQRLSHESSYSESPVVQNGNLVWRGTTGPLFLWEHLMGGWGQREGGLLGNQQMWILRTLSLTSCLTFCKLLLGECLSFLLHNERFCLENFNFSFGKSGFFETPLRAVDPFHRKLCLCTRTKFHSFRKFIHLQGLLNSRLRRALALDDVRAFLLPVKMPFSKTLDHGRDPESQLRPSFLSRDSPETLQIE